MVVMSTRMEKWIVSLVDGLDKCVDAETIAKALEQCGATMPVSGFCQEG
jgi:hypothetical protein